MGGRTRRQLTSKVFLGMACSSVPRKRTKRCCTTSFGASAPCGGRFTWGHWYSLATTPGHLEERSTPQAGIFIERGGVWAGLPGLVPAFSEAVYQVLGGIDVIRDRYPGLGFGEERRLSTVSPCETERLARRAGSAWTGRNLSRWPISGIHGPPGLLGREEVPAGRSVLAGLRGEGTALGVAAVYVEDPFAQGAAVRLQRDPDDGRSLARGDGRQPASVPRPAPPGAGGFCGWVAYCEFSLEFRSIGG